MSGGGRRGEVRIRKARPVAKPEGGTHNRAARRAAAAGKVVAAPVEHDGEEFLRRRALRTRAERDAFWAGKTESDIQAIGLAESAGLPWDATFLALLMVAIPGWTERHFKTDPKEREQRAHALGDVIAFSQGAAVIADPEARGTECEGDAAEVFNAIAEGLAIGAYCPGGATFIGVNWTVVGAELRVTNQAFCMRYPLGRDAA